MNTKQIVDIIARTHSWWNKPSAPPSPVRRQ